MKVELLLLPTSDNKERYSSVENLKHQEQQPTSSRVMSLKSYRGPVVSATTLGSEQDMPQPSPFFHSLPGIGPAPQAVVLCPGQAWLVSAPLS